MLTAFLRAPTDAEMEQAELVTAARCADRECRTWGTLLGRVTLVPANRRSYCNDSEAEAYSQHFACGHFHDDHDACTLLYEDALERASDGPEFEYD